MNGGNSSNGGIFLYVDSCAECDQTKRELDGFEFRYILRDVSPRRAKLGFRINRNSKPPELEVPGLAPIIGYNAILAYVRMALEAPAANAG